MRKRIMVGVAMSFVSALPAVAQVVAEEAARSVRDARRDATDIRSFLRAPPPEKAKIKGQIGVVYDEDEHDARTWGTPFSLSYQTPGTDWWKLQLRGDGYVDVRDPAGSSNGIADLQLNLLHPLVGSLIGYAGVTAPTHGDVGSSHWSERAKLIYSGPIAGDWSYLAIVGVSRSHASAAGVSRYGMSGYVEADYDIGQQRTLLAALARGYRRGAGGSTELNLGYDFPIASTIQGTVVLARGITRGARHTGAEFDLSFTF